MTRSRPPPAAFDSGNQAASRIGFRATEGIGNGLSALFAIKQRLSADASSSPLSSRAPFIGLGGDFGRLALGRHMISVRKQVADMDPFAATGVGSMLNANRQTTWLNNFIQYTSPSFSGLNLGGNFSNNVGFEFLGISYERLKSDAIGCKETRWNLAGAYDFGAVKISAT